MDYGRIIRRSVQISWQYKFLIVLGILAALGSGSYGSGGGGGGGSNGDPGQFAEVGDEIAALAIGLIIALGCVVLVVIIILWAISTIARGGLIAGVDSIESGEKVGFRKAWSAGWHKAGTLLGIGILPAIPGFILFILGLMALSAYGGFFALFGERISGALGVAELTIFAVVSCIVVPIVLVLSILRNFAERAAMLEDQGVVDSYRRGYSVLRENLGEAIILFLLQIAIFIVMGIFLFVPGIIVAICCFLWPLLLLFQGFVTAAVSALWTLAWRTWTGKPPLVEKVPAAV